MPQTDFTQEQETLRLLRTRGPMRSKELVDAGIHYQTLSRMAQAGKITKVRRGLYQLPESAEPDDLAEAALQVPGGVICLVSALQFHELTLQMPHKTWVAIGESAHQPKITYPPVTFVRYGKQAFSLGIETHDIGGVDFRIYAPAKTVVDCFRYRKQIGLDVALEGLRKAIESGKAKPGEIGDLARKLRIWTVIRPYLEAVAADG